MDDTSVDDLTTPPATRLPSSFWRLWAASGVSNIGDGIRAAALPLLATELSSDPRVIAGVAVCQQLPFLLFALVGGVASDRLDRRWLRVRLDALRFIAVALFTLLIVMDQASIVILFAVTLVISAAEVVVDNTTTALVPSLVEDHQLERAGGIMASTFLIGGSLIGPPLGGVLFATAIAVPFGADAATFLIAAIVAASIPGSFRPEQQASDVGTSMVAQIKAGMAWLWKHRLLRNLALLSTMLGFVNMMFNSVLVLLARDTLDLGAFGFGLLLVPSAIGGVIGSLLAQRFRTTPLPLVLTAVVVISAVAIAATGMTTIVVLVGLLTAVDSCAVVVWNVLTIALRQRMIPDHLLGRVTASYSFFVFLAMPLGALAGGFLAAATSVPTVFVVAGCVQLVIACIVPFAVRAAR